MWQEYTNGLNLSVLQPVFFLTEQRKKHQELLPKMYQVLTWLKLPSLNFYIPKLALAECVILKWEKKKKKSGLS